MSRRQIFVLCTLTFGCNQLDREPSCEDRLYQRWQEIVRDLASKQASEDLNLGLARYYFHIDGAYGVLTQDSPELTVARQSFAKLHISMVVVDAHLLRSYQRYGWQVTYNNVIQMELERSEQTRTIWRQLWKDVGEPVPAIVSWPQELFAP